jgi:hypothetical protein
LWIIDVADPAMPVLARAYGVPGQAEGLTIAGSKLLVGAGTAGLSILDVADPASPRELRGFGSGVLGNALALVGSVLYMGNPVTGLNLVDLADALAPRLFPGQPELGEGRFSVTGLTVVGERAYAVGSREGGEPARAGSHFTILDVSDPPRPRILGRLAIDGTATKVAVSGNRAYIAAGSAGLLVVDITDPRRLTHVGAFADAGPVHAVAHGERYSYVLAG